MAEYTPSEGHVRDRYVSYEALDRPGPEPDAEFDRFLARVRRDAQAEAWDECARAAYTPEGRITHGPNPYRSEED